MGMRYREKAIYLFGLRPRHTSQIITAFTGVVISVGILLTMSVVSENVRTALFSMKFLQSQIINLTAELQESRDEAQLASIRLMESQSKLEEQEKKLREIQGQLAKVQPELEKAQKELTGLKGEKDFLKKEKAQALTGISRSVGSRPSSGRLVQVRSGQDSRFLRRASWTAGGSLEVLKRVGGHFESLRGRPSLMVSPSNRHIGR